MCIRSSSYFLLMFRELFPTKFCGIFYSEDVFLLETRQWRVSTNTIASTRFGQLPPKTILSLMNHFKGFVSKFARKNTDIWKVWQADYYDRVIRSEAELKRIQEYILGNPNKWDEDKDNPANISM